MRNYSVVFVFALLLMFGCSQQPVAQAPAASEQVVQSNLDRPTTPTVYAPLTAEEMAHNERVIVAARVTQLAQDAGANKSLPKWVAEHYAAYEQEDYSRQHAAFQRSVGWGTGMYNRKEFYWFGYTNTDAFLQFDFSVPISAEDLGKVIGGRNDQYGRLREARFPSSDSSFLPGTATWIGDTNDWTEDFCIGPKSEVCDLGGALKRSVADLNKDLQLYLGIKGTFPW